MLAARPILNCESGYLEKDSQMMERYTKCKPAFQQLAAIIEKQNREGVICPCDQNSHGPFGGEELANCKTALQNIGSDLCTVINKDNGVLSIDVPIWARGALSGGPSKGYFYSQKISKNLVTTLDPFAYGTLFDTNFKTTSGMWLRSLNDNWYIYYRFEK